MMIKPSRTHPIGKNPWVWKFLLCGAHDWQIFDWHKSELQIKVMSKGFESIIFRLLGWAEFERRATLETLIGIAPTPMCPRNSETWQFGIHTSYQVFYIITHMYNNQTHSLPLKGKIATSTRPVEYCFQLQMPPFGTEEETFIKKDLKHLTNGKGWN